MIKNVSVVHVKFRLSKYSLESCCSILCTGTTVRSLVHLIYNELAVTLDFSQYETESRGISFVTTDSYNYDNLLLTN